MQLQQARVRGVAHCIIPQEFTIQNPMPIIPPMQQLLPVDVQLSGSAAVVQVLVPSNQVIPNQIPVLVTSNVHHTTTITTTTTTTAQPPVVPQVVATAAPLAVVIEPQTVASFVLNSTPKTVTTTPDPIYEEATTVELSEPEPAEMSLETEIKVNVEPPLKEIHPVSEPANSSGQLPIGTRTHYSADPIIDDDDELLSNGILDVAKTIQGSVPEVVMPPGADHIMGKLVMPQPEEDPPEMLHDQEVLPLPTVQASKPINEEDVM